MLPAVKASNVIPFTVTYQATVVPDSSQWGTFSEFSEGKYRHVRCFLHLLASRRMHSVRLFSVVPYWGNPSCRTLLLPTVRIYETHCFRPNCRLRELVCQALSSLRTLNNVELQSNLTDRLKSPTSQELHTHKSSHFTQGGIKASHFTLTLVPNFGDPAGTDPTWTWNDRTIESSIQRKSNAAQFSHTLL